VPIRFALCGSATAKRPWKENPAPLDEQVGQGLLFASGPQQARLDELRSVDQICLLGQHTEEKVAVVRSQE
jgi:hypothetical protein